MSHLSIKSTVEVLSGFGSTTALNHLIESSILDQIESLPCGIPQYSDISLPTLKASPVMLKTVRQLRTRMSGTEAWPSRVAASDQGTLFKVAGLLSAHGRIPSHLVNPTDYQSFVRDPVARPKIISSVQTALPSLLNEIQSLLNEKFSTLEYLTSTYNDYLDTKEAVYNRFMFEFISHGHENTLRAKRDIRALRESMDAFERKPGINFRDIKLITSGVIGQNIYYSYIVSQAISDQSRTKALDDLVKKCENGGGFIDIDDIDKNDYDTRRVYFLAKQRAIWSSISELGDLNAEAYKHRLTSVEKGGRVLTYPSDTDNLYFLHRQSDTFTAGSQHLKVFCHVSLTPKNHREVFDAPFEVQGTGMTASRLGEPTGGSSTGSVSVKIFSNEHTSKDTIRVQFRRHVSLVVGRMSS